MSHISLLNACRLLLAAATCLPVLSLAADKAAWAEIGPFQAPFKDLRGGSDGRNLYSMPNNYTLYASRDGGAHWDNLLKSLPAIPRLQDILVDPLDSSKVWLLDVAGTLRVSNDAGRNWRIALTTGELPSDTLYGASLPCLRVDSSNPKRIYLFAFPTVYRSDDGGENWSKYAADSEITARYNGIHTDVISNPANGDFRAIISRVPEDVVFVSKDQGRTWQDEGRVTSDFTRLDSAVSLVNGARHFYSYAAGNSTATKGLYRWSVGTPNKWQFLLPLWSEQTKFFPAWESDAILASATDVNKVGLSLDAGSTWRTLQLPGGFESRSLYASNSEVLIGGQQLLSSRDSGQSWQVKASGGLGSLVQGIGRDCRGLRAATDSGVYTAADGLNWSLSTTDQGVVAAVDGLANTLYRTRTSPVTLAYRSSYQLTKTTPSVSALEVSRDCGKTWQTAALPPRSEGSPSFDRVKPIVDVVAGKERWYLQVYRSEPDCCPSSPRLPFELYQAENAVGPWSLNATLQDIEVVYHDARLPDSWLFLGQRRSGHGGLYGAKLLHSDDGGKSVDEVDLDGPEQEVSYITISSGGEPGVYYALLSAWQGTSNYRTSDGGKTWTKLATTLESLLIHPTRPSEMYSIFASGRIHRSNDQGATWQPLPALSGIYPDRPMGLYLDAETDHLMINTDAGIQSLDVHPEVAATLNVEAGSGGGCTTGGVRGGVDISLLMLLGLSAVWSARKLARWR
ncbi:MAG: hypothetical protein U1F55_10050 [Chitinivorax sp.]